MMSLTGLTVSSDEYEESDEEPAKKEELPVSRAESKHGSTKSSQASEDSDIASTTLAEDFTIKKVVRHIVLKKGEIQKQGRDLRLEHTFNHEALEKSKWNYAFRVRWEGYGPSDDTWEPIENFPRNNKMLRKYCEKKCIPMPKGYRDWMYLPDTPAVDDGSSSDSDDDDKKKEKGQKEKKHKIIDLVEKPKQKYDVRKDLELSPSPNPARPPKKEEKAQKAFNALFDITDDEEPTKEQKRKKEEEREKRKEEKKNKNDDSSDKTKLSLEEVVRKRKREEKKRKKQEKAKREAEMQWKNSGQSLTDELEKKVRMEKDVEERMKKAKEFNKRLHEEEEEERKRKKEKEDEEERKKKKKEEEEERRKKKEKEEIEKDDLMKKGMDIIKELEEEEKRKKEKKRLQQIAKEKETGQEATLNSGTSSSSNSRERSVDRTKRISEERWAPIPEALRQPTEAAAHNGEKLSHYELEQKRRKRKMEEKRKEKEREGKGDEKRKEEKKENREEKKDYKYEKKPERSGLDSSRLRDVSNKKKVGEPREEKLRKACNRLGIILNRRALFDSIVWRRDQWNLDIWNKEEREWRARMYAEGRWRRNRNIDDEPFDLRAEKKITNTKSVRTLRRCASTERLPLSSLRLSSIPSMNTMTMKSRAQSLAGVLIDELSMKKAMAYRTKREAMKRIKTEKDEETCEAAPDSTELDSKIEEFIADTLIMAEQLKDNLSEDVTEAAIRGLSHRVITAFLSLDHDEIIPLFYKIHDSACINYTIMRLVRIFSSVVNLSVAAPGCKDACDEGAHRKCRMLLTLLMALSDRLRFGDGDEFLLPPNTLYDAVDEAAPCQIRVLIRGGCTFDDYYDVSKKCAAHRMLEGSALSTLRWLIPRGLDVNSLILPTEESDLSSDKYDKPWKAYKEANEMAAFTAQLHSSRLNARSLAWTKGVKAVESFNLRPLTLVHTMNAAARSHHFIAVTLCDEKRKGFDKDDAVILAVHAVEIKAGKGLRTAGRKSKKIVPEISVPYFLINRAKNDESYEIPEEYQCVRARLTIHNLARPALSETVELEKIGVRESTTLFKVPKKQAQYMASGRRFVEPLLKCVSPPEFSALLGQFFIVPFKNASG